MKLSNYYPRFETGEIYIPSMMQYDGSSYLTDGGTFTTSGNLITVVCRFLAPSVPSANGRIIESKDIGGDFRVYVGTETDGKIRVFSETSANVTLCQLYSPVSYCDNEIHTLLYSFDADNGTAVFLIDGIDADDTGNGSRVAPTTGTLAGGAGTRFGVGAGDTGTAPVEAGTLIGFVGYDSQYITTDTSFFDASGNPIKQDETIWANSGWGSQPLFWNEHGDLKDNKGSAVDMTDSGAITVVEETPVNAAAEFLDNTVYTPVMMQYDGSTTYYSETSYTASGNKVTAVVRFKRDSFTGGGTEFIICASPPSFQTYYRAVVFTRAADHTTTSEQGKLIFLVRNSGGTDICKLISNSVICDGEPHTVFVDFDGDSGTGTLIIDGVDEDDTGATNRVAPTTGTLGSGAGSDFTVGAGSTAGTNLFGGNVGFVGTHDTSGLSYLDFMDSNGNPVKQDEITWANSGWGSQPLFWNEHGCMTNNKGSVGNMTENGTITVADESVVTAPSEVLRVSPRHKEFIYQSLLSFWPMDEYSAGTATVSRADAHMSNDLDDNGGLYVPSVEDAAIGRAAHFVNTTSDGAGASNLKITGTPIFNMTNGFTAWAWVVPYYLDNWSYILAKSDNASSSVSGEAWAMGIAGDETFFSRVISNNADNIAYSSEIASTNTPYFLCMVYDYVNGFHGISVNGGSLVTSSIAGFMDYDGDTFQVGRRGYATNRMYFMGAMNRVGIANSAFNLDQIKWLYNNGVGRSYGELQ